MGRKRKVPIADEEKENTAVKARQRGCGGGGGVPSQSTNNSMMHHGPMYTIMSNVQLNETSHKRYIKELQQLYTTMDHDAFMFTLIKMIKTAMVAEECNEYADTTLLFCSKFVSAYDGDDTHPILIDICKWLLTTISRNPHIRFRICQFVNMILKALGQEAALDDAICDRIMEYMLQRLHDTSPNVRVQAILAMQRLQVPDNPDDPVLRAYQFHLCSDPSSRVRQAVITCMGRNYHTIPYILERLWDIDEKVRRHTYLHMSSYPVRSYKVSQRLTLLQQGLNDRSECVRKVVVTIMLQQWIESYQKDLIGLISALKLDSSESDIDRFRKVAKQTLKEIFKRQSKEDLLACIPLEEEGEMHRCVPFEKLTMEIALYWQCLTEFLQAEMAEESDMVVPELSTFCAYVEKFCQSQKPDMDKFELMEFQYKLLSLMEILYTFDLGDEIGRGNLQKLLAYLLKTFRLDEKVIEVIVRCAENLITDQSARIQLFVEIIQDICDLNGKPNDLLHDRTLITELLASSTNADLNLKLSSLKVKILDLEEQEMNFVQRKDYTRAQQITEEKHATTEEYTNLLQPLLDKHSNAEMLKGPLQLRKTLKPEEILKSLQIAFYMVVSPKVRSLNPSILKLYNDFICRHLASNQIAIRDWALKCGTACSMLYEALAKDVFEELYAQFFKNHNIRIWETSITCIFELLDRYGLDNFAKQEEQNKTKKSGRQLYNTLEFLDSEDDSNVLSAGQGVDVIYMMSHFLDTCDDACIVSAIIVGFCRLILRGYIKSSDIIEKLLLRYFNPSTDSKINQILGVFLENLIQRKKHGLLQPCLLPMVSTVLGAPYENPLHDIRPETITRFIIDSTRQENSAITEGNIHNKIAQTFLQEMLNNLSNKELCKLLAKELLTLELSVLNIPQMRCEMKEAADKLIKSEMDPKNVKCIIDFKDLVDGNYNPQRKTVTNNSEIEEDSNDETENEAKDDDDNATVTTARSKTSASEPIDEAQQQQQQLPTIQLSAATPSRVVTNETCDQISSIQVNAPSIVEALASTAVPAPASESGSVVSAPASSIASGPASVGSAEDNSIITKDISPSAAHVPTTYGRENRVGHRYLRKSLNSTRGQSDSEAGDGPRRSSPKIRIEARIDSDKKAKQQPAAARKQRQVRSTRARRNLRYGGGGGGGDRNNETEEDDDDDDDVVVVVEQVRKTNARNARNRSPREKATPTIISSPTKRQAKEANAEQTRADGEPAEKTRVPKRNEQKNAKLAEKTKEQSTEEQSKEEQSKEEQSKEEQSQEKEPSSEQPKEQPALEQTKQPSKQKQQEKELLLAQPRGQVTTRARNLQQQKKMSPTKSNKISSRAVTTRGTAKTDELNTSDVIPPSPPAAMSPRTLVRRQRRAGIVDISVVNLMETQSRHITRSRSAQSTFNKDSDSSTDSETENRTAKPSKTPARSSLKRAHTSTPNPNGGARKSQSPHQKRMRTESKSKKQQQQQQQSPRSVQSAISAAQTRDRAAAHDSSTPSSPEKRKREQRPGVSAESQLKSGEATSKSLSFESSSNLNEANSSKAVLGSATRTRSLTRASSPTRTRSTRQIVPLTRTRSSSGPQMLTRIRSSIRALSQSARRQSISRTSSLNRSRSTISASSSLAQGRAAAKRTGSSTRVRSLTRSRSDIKSKSTTRTKSATSTRDSSAPSSARSATRTATAAQAVVAESTIQSKSTGKPVTPTQTRINTRAGGMRKQNSAPTTPSERNIAASANAKQSKTTEKLQKISAALQTRTDGGGVMTRRRRHSMDCVRSDAEDIAAADTATTSGENEESESQDDNNPRNSKANKSTKDAATEAAESKKSSQRVPPSKIPVRASNSKLTTVMKPRHIALRAATSSQALAPKAIQPNSGSGSGSGTSSSDEAVRTLGTAVLRRRALTTKMTRIDLTQRSKGNPVPMAAARPKRVPTAVNSLATGRNLRNVKKR